MNLALPIYFENITIQPGSKSDTCKVSINTNGLDLPTDAKFKFTIFDSYFLRAPVPQYLSVNTIYNNDLIDFNTVNDNSSDITVKKNQALAIVLVDNNNQIYRYMAIEIHEQYINYNLDWITVSQGSTCGMIKLTNNNTSKNVQYKYALSFKNPSELTILDFTSNLLFNNNATEILVYNKDVNNYLYLGAIENNELVYTKIIQINKTDINLTPYDLTWITTSCGYIYQSTKITINDSKLKGLKLTYKYKITTTAFDSFQGFDIVPNEYDILPTRLYNVSLNSYLNIVAIDDNNRIWAIYTELLNENKIQQTKVDYNFSNLFTIVKDINVLFGGDVYINDYSILNESNIPINFVFKYKINYLSHIEDDISNQDISNWTTATLTDKQFLIRCNLNTTEPMALAIAILDENNYIIGFFNTELNDTQINMAIINFNISLTANPLDINSAEIHIIKNNNKLELINLANQQINLLYWYSPYKLDNIKLYDNFSVSTINNNGYIVNRIENTQILNDLYENNDINIYITDESNKIYGYGYHNIKFYDIYSEQDKLNEKITNSKYSFNLYKGINNSVRLLVMKLDYTDEILYQINNIKYVYREFDYNPFDLPDDILLTENIISTDDLQSFNKTSALEKLYTLSNSSKWQKLKQSYINGIAITPNKYIIIAVYIEDNIGNTIYCNEFFYFKS